MIDPNELSERRESLLRDGYDPDDYRGETEDARIEAAEAARDAVCYDRDELSHQGDD